MSLLLANGSLLAQSDTTRQAIEIDFLFHYYEQDGIHSAVTGGLGTEELTDRAGKIVVSVPMDSVQKLRFSTNVNHYTSASTDKIDSYVSSASVKDSRAWIQVGYERKANKQVQWGISGAGSIESDYISSSLSAFRTWTSKDENRLFDLSFQGFFDTWIVIFPEELRAPGLASVPTDKRRSVSLSAQYQQVINSRLQVAIGLETVVQQGLLSTPFHRVYFNDPDQTVAIEQLPGWRIKYPLGLRLNWFATDWLLFRSYYRFYYDSFGILAHTASLELPIKLGLSLTVLPSYRIHTQSASQYFAPHALHLVDAPFYTSDYDLSAFIAHKAAVGIRYSPLYGLTRFRLGAKRIALLKSLTLRYAYYQRSDGLDSHIFGLHLSWRL